MEAATSSSKAEEAEARNITLYTLKNTEGGAKDTTIAMEEDSGLKVNPENITPPCNGITHSWKAATEAAGKGKANILDPLRLVPSPETPTYQGHSTSKGLRGRTRGAKLLSRLPLFGLL